MTDADALLAANSAFYTAFNNRDYPAMEALWSGRDDLACVHPGWMILLGREAVLGSWRAILENPGQGRLVSGRADAAIYGDVGVVYSREFVAGAPVIATNVFLREDGRWRLLHHHAGPVVAMPGEG